jgi:hypothetical protein
MIKHYPAEFTLDSGTHVVVTKNEGKTYDFSLTPKHGAAHHFTYTDDNRPKAEIEEGLDFEELNALRMFWLKNEDI